MSRKRPFYKCDSITTRKLLQEGAFNWTAPSVCLGGELCLLILLMISRELCEHDAVSKMGLLALPAIQTPHLFVNQSN